MTMVNEVSSVPEPISGDRDIQEAVKPVLVLPPAGLLQRIGAFLIDMLILGILCTGIGLLFGSLLVGLGIYARLVSATIALFYFAFFHSKLGHGNTPGMRAFNLSVYDRDEKWLSFPRALLRSFIPVVVLFFGGLNPAVFSTNAFLMFVMTIPLGLGCVMIYLLWANRETGQCLHDLLVGTRVVRDRGDPVEAHPVGVSRKHMTWAIGIATLIVVVSWGLGQNQNPVYSPTQQKIITIYQELSQDQRFWVVGVYDGQKKTSEGQTVRQLLVSLAIRNDLDDPTRKNVVQGVAGRVPSYVSMSDYNDMVVQVSNMYDLGFFKRAVTWVYTPPDDWSYQVEQNTFLGFFTFTITYTQ